MTTASAYLNGNWISGQDLCLPIDDLGFIWGATIVERLRTFNGQLFRPNEHYCRLHRSLEIVGWGADTLCAQVSEACDGFLDRNATLFQKGDDWNVIVFITPGKTLDARQPTVCVHGQPLPFHSWADQYQLGVHCTIVDVQQVPDQCWPTELKCRSRMHYFLADHQARTKAPGAQAILLDGDGHIGEAPTANVVAYYKDRGLVTPRRSKVLPGVSQQVLFELADSLSLPHLEDDLTPTQLASADEIFLTSTSICLLPVVKLDDQDIANRTPGPVYNQLLAAWSELVGTDIPTQAQAFGNRKAVGP
ncbi:MAG: hypothetical protein GXP26_07300 [Planctomycetes bacterium]|nr:hypothetical protein [Planctomycetota bacterium]